VDSGGHIEKSNRKRVLLVDYHFCCKKFRVLAIYSFQKLFDHLKHFVITSIFFKAHAPFVSAMEECIEFRLGNCRAFAKLAISVIISFR
jgi:hypothetical protein